MLKRITLMFSLAALLGVSPADAECNSYYGGTDIEYLEYVRSQYTICYGPSGDQFNDRNLVRNWVNKAFRLGREKYKVRTLESWGSELKLTIYLPPNPTSATSQGVVRFACCYHDRHGMVGKNGRTLQHAEIHYFTPSAWEGEVFGGLRRPATDYHPHYLTHEMMHLFQFVCCSQEAYQRGYNVPSWITEGMAESDGYRHTTDYNREDGVEKLNEKFVTDELRNVIWGRNLDLKRAFQVSSIYWAGGFVMNYLAETHGDAIHYELLKDDLGVVLERYNSSITDLFVDLLVLTEQLKDEKLTDDDRDATYSEFTQAIAPVRVEEPACRLDIVHP